MAELNSSKEIPDKKRSKKLSTRVDLTAMVDLAFLLITFFMLSTTLAKPQAMDLAMPDSSDTLSRLPVPATRTVSLCLGKNNQLLLFRGLINTPIGTPKILGYNKHEFRESLLTQMKKIQAETGKSMMVLIKPSKSSTYENLVNTLDEMKITAVTSYAIVDITKSDEELMQKKGL